MFTLSAIFLEVREILFQDFWSPFSISFFSARWNIFFKIKPDAEKLTKEILTESKNPEINFHGPLVILRTK